MIKMIKKALSVLLSGALLLSVSPIVFDFEADAASVCSINTNKTYQMIQGFGGINLREWTGYDLTDAEVQRAFGNGDGELGMSILRIYVNDDSSKWNLAIPVAKKAQSLGATVFATPWNPPASMRTNGNGQPRGGKYVLKDGAEGQYATHLNNFIKYCEGQGVNLYSVAVQNEPDWSGEWTYWSPERAANFIANYGEQVKSGTNAKLMSPESFSYSKDYYNAILNNSKALANCDLFGTHFYGTQRSAMDFPALENSGKDIWMTEVYVPDSKISCEAYPDSLEQSVNIHNGLVVGNMNAYVVWYIKRSYGPLNESGQISKRGYCMAQYSKYVRPGDVRIDATEQPNTNILVSAYKHSADQIEIVAINNGTSEVSQQFSVDNRSITNVDRYRTSANENIAPTKDMNYSGSSFYAQLPAKSVSTFVVSLVSDGIDVPENPNQPVVIEPETPDENGYYFHDTFENGTCSWEGRGGASVNLGTTAYAGAKALTITNREKAWNGTQKTLNYKTFEAGKEYSFSICVNSATSQNMMLSLQYTDASGETKYDHIAQGISKGGYVLLTNTNYKIPDGATAPVLYVESESGTSDFSIDEAIGAIAGTVVNGPEPINYTMGDVNADGEFNISDVVLLQKWILAVPNTSLAKWKAGDFCEDNTLNMLDLCLMKSELTQAQTQTNIVETPTVQVKINPSEYMAQVASKIVGSEPSGATAENAGTAYGKYEKVSFTSAVCGGRTKSFNVLLPANYSTSKKYPVLYALHGYWGDEDALLDKGDASLRLRQIIGNAIASGEAEDMIVVFPDIYASATQDKCDGLNDKNNVAYDNFINELTKEIMPYMEQHYSIKTGRDNTAITGFSMGGRESIYIGLSRPDLFGYIGAMCPAPGVPLSNDKFKFNDVEPYLFFISAGSNDTLIYSTPEGYHNTLTSNNTTHVWHYVNGGDHGGKTIRPHMYNFIRYIFKANV